MREDVKSELLFHIESEFSDRQVDSKQLLNQITEFEDGFLLRAYGKVLNFNQDGELL